ncbi:MAG: LamG-like jellyroll fold domain-containing protein [Candidatus Eisenbacteria bacterium]
MPRSPRLLRVLLLTVVLLSLPAVASRAAVLTNYVLQWGTPGTGNGQFNEPVGVAVDFSGNVYVTDMGNDRVQVFNSSGVWQYSFGGTGSGPGQFRRPYGISINGGDLYVVDTGNYRVQKFTLAGSFVLQWGSLGSGNGQFQNPRGVAASGTGSVFVTDASLDRVQSFDGLGTYQLQWGSTGSAPGQFRGPIGIVADAGGGAVIVADSLNHRIQRFDSLGNLLNLWGTQGNGNGQFQGPVGIASNGFEYFGVDTGNDRMQKFNYSYLYATQWGGTGAGNGQFVRPHAAAVDGSYIYVTDTGNHRVQKFGPPSDGPCPTCFSPPEACCAALPQIGGPWTNIAVGTRESDPNDPWPYVVTIFDLNSTPLPPEDANWASMTRYTGPGAGWRADSLGSVFGLTLDPYGNIFVAHSSCYATERIGQVFGGAPGAIYRIDAVTGAITTFCVLPNQQDPLLAVGDNYPGLGNITYDCQHQQFFVTNLEDGKLYRIQANGVNGTTGSVIDAFDPMAPDNGLTGWAAVGERLWGVQVHGNRVYYAVWALDMDSGNTLNEIRSVGLTPAGAFAAGSDQHEFWLPMLTSYNFSFPVADITFSIQGRMLVGERGIYTMSYPYAHYARALEYQCSGGCWIPANSYSLGVGNGNNSEGGVDYDAHPFNGPTGAIGRVWVTTDAMHSPSQPPYTDDVYGYQGLRPNLPAGSVLNSMLIDSDGPTANFGDKSQSGDIEVPGCPAVETGAICGRKFIDSNRNGVKDPAESYAAGWTIRATGPGGTYTAVTDANGNYCFTNLLAGTWTLSEVAQPSYVQTAPASVTYSVSLAGGQTLFGYDFGNYACAPGGPGCVQPPTGMSAWYPFAPTQGAGTTAADVTHLSPARNAAQLVGGAVILPPGLGGGGGLASFGGLHLATAADYARVPYADQLDLNFGEGSFSIDAWVNPDPGIAGERTIVEKRHLNSASPYRMLGWALYLDGQQLTLEIGNGIETQVVPGPTIPAGDWSHIAVAVDRDSPSGIGRWYVNGTPFAAADFAPLAGSVSNAADVYIGQANPAFGSKPGLGGTIVHLEIFRTVLPGGSVSTITAAYVAGKCPEFIALPSVTTICNNANTVQVCFSICNTTATARTYRWSAAGLAAGAGCTVAGPTQFNPPGGTVTVPAGGCSPPICMTVTRPPGLTTHNTTACYGVSIFNNATGVCYTKQGKLRADNCWCVTPIQHGVVSVPARVAAGTAIGIGIDYPCGPIPAASYRVSAVWLNTEHPDPQALSLNGLPPGTPVVGTLSGGATGLSVQASFPDGYDPAAPYEIVFEHDPDGNDDWERWCGTVVTSAYDTTQVVGVTPGPVSVESVRLLATPNPFMSGSTITFSLARVEEVAVGVYDLTGRRVRSLRVGRLAAGPHRFEWNGRDDSGRRVAAGVYFARLGMGARHLEVKIVKLQ